MNGSVKRFSLIELLVAIAIIAILAAILLPALSRAKYQAQNLLCVNHLSQLSKATFMYCDDNDGYYPDRGSDPKQYSYTNASVERWASRISYGGGALAPHRSLATLMHQYCPSDTGVWVDPLYRGTDKGDHVVGMKYKQMGGYHGSFSYGMHAGTQEWTNASWTFHTRLKVGDPLELTDPGGKTYSLRALWSDGGPNHENLFAPGYYQGTVGTYHSPPPGRAWIYKDTSDWGKRLGDLRVMGQAKVTWGWDDGAIRSMDIPITKTSTNDFVVHLFQGDKGPTYPRDQ